MNLCKLRDLCLFYNLHIYVCLHLTFLELQWVMPTCYPQGEHVKEGAVLLIFVVLLLQMAINLLVIFVPHNKRGVTVSFNFKMALYLFNFLVSFPFLFHKLIW